MTANNVRPMLPVRVPHAGPWEVVEETRSNERTIVGFQGRASAEDYAAIRVQWYRDRNWQLTYEGHDESQLTLDDPVWEESRGRKRTVTIKVQPKGVR